MSPLVLIVFGPVILGGIAFVALLLGAASAGAWEAVEAGTEPSPPAAVPALSIVSQPEIPHSRAA